MNQLINNLSELLNKGNTLKWDDEVFNISSIDATAFYSRLDYSIYNFPWLISNQASDYLESMAKGAKQLTQQYHGKVMHLYVPLYLSNYCINHCVYCGFNKNNTIERKTLNLKEIEQEARALSEKGYRDILLLTGEDPREVSLPYLLDAVSLVKQYFSTVGIEIYPLDSEGYSRLVNAGVSHLTLYQECYDRELYKQLHPQGPKSNYDFRLNAPEEAAKAGIAGINIGTLLGLGDWRRELYCGALHLEYLQKKYPGVEYAYSFPRIKQHFGQGFQGQQVYDRDFVQAVLAMRLVFPSVGLSLSTRESADLRNNLLELGITRLSAGSRTTVGGYVKTALQSHDHNQFSISDHRDLCEIVQLLQQKGYQPVYKNWEALS